jgi:hypothetical protein
MKTRFFYVYALVALCQAVVAQPAAKPAAPTQAVVKPAAAKPAAEPVVDRPLDASVSPLDAAVATTPEKPPVEKPRQPIVIKGNAPLPEAAPDRKAKKGAATVLTVTDMPVPSLVGYLEKRMAMPIAYYGSMTATITGNYNNKSFPAVLEEIAASQNLILVADQVGYAMVPSIGKYRTSSDWQISREQSSDIAVDSRIAFLKKANPDVFIQAHRVAGDAQPTVVAVYPKDKRYAAGAAPVPRPSAMGEVANRSPADNQFFSDIAAERARLLQQRSGLLGQARAQGL